MTRNRRGYRGTITNHIMSNYSRLRAAEQPEDRGIRSEPIPLTMEEAARQLAEDDEFQVWAEAERRAGWVAGR